MISIINKDSMEKKLFNSCDDVQWHCVEKYSQFYGSWIPILLDTIFSVLMAGFQKSAAPFPVQSKTIAAR